MRGLRIFLSGVLWLAACGLLHAGAALPPDMAAHQVDSAQHEAGVTVAVSAADIAWQNRVTYGANADTVARFSRMGRSQFLTQQLTAAEPAVPDAVAARISRLTRLQQPLEGVMLDRLAAVNAHRAITADKEAKRVSRKAMDKDINAYLLEARSRLLLRSVYSDNQVAEQMAWFWFNHFNVFAGKADVAYLVDDYEDSMRPYVLGNFRDLLRVTVTHPAMLQYLDNRRSKKGKLNENYARELMELHTLGVDGGYTQKDVQELARILTGLALVPLDAEGARPVTKDPDYRRFGLVEFNPRQHDSGSKVLLGRAIAGTGWAEIEEVIDILLRHPATSRHLARKIATHFVADAPPPALVERMAARFRDSGGDIRAVLEVMFTSPEFADAAGQKYKSSWQYVVSALRVAPGEMTPSDIEQAMDALQRLAQLPYSHTTPDGFGLAGKAWRSPGQLETRLGVAGEIAARAAAHGVPVASRIDALLPMLGSENRARITAETDPRRRLMLLVGAPEFMYR